MNSLLQTKSCDSEFDGRRATYYPQVLSITVSHMEIVVEIVRLCDYVLHSVNQRLKGPKASVDEVRTGQMRANSEQWDQIF